METTPIMTRRTVELLRGHMVQNIIEQLSLWCDSTTQLCTSYLSQDISRIRDTLPEYAREYFPRKITLAKTLVMVLGESNLKEKYLQTMKQLEEDIFKKIEQKSLPPELISSTFQRYDRLFQRILSGPLTKESAPITNGNIVSQIQQFLIFSTEFDFLFTTLILALLDEIPEPSNDKLQLIAEMSSKKILEFETSYETLNLLLGGRPSHEEISRKELFLLAGTISDKETEKIITAIEESCERIDAEW